MMWLLEAGAMHVAEVARLQTILNSCEFSYGSDVPRILLAASGDLPQVWGRFDHEKPGFEWNQALVVAGAMALGMAVVFVWHRLTGRSSKDFAINSPGRLFRELSRAHKLSGANRRLLKRLAVAHGQPNAALLFVEPKFFDTRDLPVELQSNADELADLRARLFGPLP